MLQNDFQHDAQAGCYICHITSKTWVANFEDAVSTMILVKASMNLESAVIT